MPSLFESGVPAVADTDAETPVSDACRDAETVAAFAATDDDTRASGARGDTATDCNRDRRAAFK
jgi:hypothetical protein